MRLVALADRIMYNEVSQYDTEVMVPKCRDSHIGLGSNIGSHSHFGMAM